MHIFVVHSGVRACICSVDHHIIHRLEYKSSSGLGRVDTSVADAPREEFWALVVVSRLPFVWSCGSHRGGIAFAYNIILFSEYFQTT